MYYSLILHKKFSWEELWQPRLLLLRLLLRWFVREHARVRVSPLNIDLEYVGGKIELSSTCQIMKD